MSTPELILRWAGGQIDLMGWNGSPYGDYEVETLAEGTNWGNPESVRRTLRSALLDGSRSTKERDSNRTVPISLRVAAADPSALAGGEGELDKIDGRRCELVWTPPRNMGIAPSVFVVDYADLMHEMDDLAEHAGERFWKLTLNCQPHVYSDEWVIIPALVQGTSTPVLVDACETLTGWSVDGGGTITVSSGQIQLNRPDGYTQSGIDAAPVAAVRTGTVDFTTQRYLSIEAAVVFGLLTVQAKNAGGNWVTLPRVGADGADSIFDTDPLASPVASALRFLHPGGQFPILLRNVEKQATPRSGGGRQQVRTLDVPGSRRTPATLLVESPTTGLGTVILYSGPPYNPDLSRGALGTRFADPSGLATLSGAVTQIEDYEPLESFEIPAAELFEGSHSAWVRARTNGGPGTLTLTARTPGATTSTGDVGLTSEVIGSVRLTSAAHELKLMGAGGMLPSARLPEGTTAKIRFDLSWVPDTTGVGHVALVDTVLVFNRTLGKLTIAEVGAQQKLWLSPATLEADHPTAYAGSDTFDESIPLSLLTDLRAWGADHAAEPPVTYLYVGSTEAPDATVSARFRPAWHTHPAS